MPNICPCGFAIHRGIIAGLWPAQIENPLIHDSGITNPRGHIEKQLAPSLGIANPREHVSEDKTPREVAVDAFLHQIVTNDRWQYDNKVLPYFKNEPGS